MPTCCNIAKLNDDKTLNYVFCNFDGYPEYVGNLLFEIYNTNEKIDELFANGDMSYLDETIEDSRFYIRDFGETAETASLKTVQFDELMRSGTQIDYTYIFENGIWKYCKFGKIDFKTVKKID